jgi:hypothetical protein
VKWTSTSASTGGRKGAILTAALILIGAAVASCSPAIEDPTSNEAGGPRIVFEESDVGLGKAAPTDRIEYEFRFRNVGDAPLVISDISTKTLEGC